MYVGGRPYSILKIAGAKVKVQWELDESYKKCQRHAGDQMVAQGAGVRSAWGALGASWIMSDGGAKQPRIMSDGGARQPRYGIRFKRTGQASEAHVAHYVHLGSRLMAGQAAPVQDQIPVHGGCQQRTWRIGIMSDGRARQPRYGIRLKRTGKASGAHVAHCVHLGSCMMAGQACNHTTHIVISFVGWCTSRRREARVG
ncbi:hypothetical protein B0H17DRAFT_1147499 [Mycena rosella]|uniref:Uncharacterized protein n=1 Tax=Mycena rosella TaxID=1033263 RepID=A0AAD7CLJ9_MYCRO|nr:hypothetical protein B0H17DRAFT_1147499 [Mycena rosella]